MKSLELAGILANTEGRIFTATFVKRTTGEVRTMTCRTGVKKHKSGAGLAFNPIKKNLLPVWDIDADGYRFISVDALLSAVVDGKEYKVAA